MRGLRDSSDDLLVLLGAEVGAVSTPPTDDPLGRLVLAALDITDPAVGARLLQALRDEERLAPDRLAASDPAEIIPALASLRLKLTPNEVRTLVGVARWLVNQHQGSIEALSQAATDELRGELIALKGIGPATADRILSRGLDRPVLPVDRGSYRIALRHGWIDLTSDYEEARSRLEGVAADQPEALRLLSDGLQVIARQFCRVGRPRCERCPLRPLLEGDPPILPESDDG